MMHLCLARYWGELWLGTMALSAEPTTVVELVLQSRTRPVPLSGPST
jgi:hypothetical protein